MKKVLYSLILVTVVLGSILAYIYLPVSLLGCFNKSALAIGDIAAPRGCVKVDGLDTAYTSFLRSIPLAEESSVHYYKGGKVSKLYTGITYAVVDIPLLSNSEQCADACMHMRSEYLYRSGQYGRICFRKLDGTPMKYHGGRIRMSFEQYLRKVFNSANTKTLVNELPIRDLNDIQPGDIFVHQARPGRKYGHAIMVMDVAVNPKTGKKYVMLAEGSTPAVDIHILRNGCSAWFPLNEKSSKMRFCISSFYKDELRYFR